MTHAITRQETYSTTGQKSWGVSCSCGRFRKSFTDVDVANQAAEAHKERARKTPIRGEEVEVDGTEPFQPASDGAL